MFYKVCKYVKSVMLFLYLYSSKINLPASPISVNNKGKCIYYSFYWMHVLIKKGYLHNYVILQLIITSCGYNRDHSGNLQNILI